MSDLSPAELRQRAEANLRHGVYRILGGNLSEEELETERQLDLLLQTRAGRAAMQRS